MTHTASPKQIAFITRLLSEKALTDTNRQSVQTVLDHGSLNGRDASAMIGWLLAFPSAPAAPGTAAAPGYYVREGEVFVVVENKAKTNTYAKALVIHSHGHASWEYAPGVGRSLAADGLTPLSVDEAARLGHQHGVCVVCTRALTDPKSVERGIGPVCAKRLTS